MIHLIRNTYCSSCYYETSILSQNDTQIKIKFKMEINSKSNYVLTSTVFSILKSFPLAQSLLVQFTKITGSDFRIYSLVNSSWLILHEIRGRLSIKFSLLNGCFEGFFSYIRWIKFVIIVFGTWAGSN